MLMKIAFKKRACASDFFSMKKTQLILTPKKGSESKSPLPSPEISGIVRGNSATKTRHPFHKTTGGWGFFFLKVLRWVGRSFWFQLQVVPIVVLSCFCWDQRTWKMRMAKKCQRTGSKTYPPATHPAAGGKIHLPCVRTEETVVSHGQGPRNRSLTDNMMQQYTYII